jgi:hypothetical protein
VVVAAAPAVLASSVSAQEPPGTRPAAASRLAVAASGADGLRMVVNERGRISKSVAGFTSDDTGGTSRVVTKPPGATVRKAYLSYATTGFTQAPLSEPLTIDGRPVPLTDEVPSGISSYNYFADVTALVKPKLDAAPAGLVEVKVAEPEPSLTEGAILAVIYDDPAVRVEQTVTVLYGALSPTGDRYEVQLASPISLTDPATRLEMSLGISYSYQESGSQQFSQVDVNGRRLTTSAGGEDDGLSHNGALLTVGGDGDDIANPPDAAAAPAQPRSDDELYDLRPFVSTGDRTIQVSTANPSLDDNVFLAIFAMNPPVTSVSTGDQFVYVALGDSYSSGEGAALDLRPQADYLERGYENGHNYPSSTGDQENTYGETGNGCHRALLNYAKINRDKLAANSQVVLVDRTCSGAKIEPEPNGKPPVVGTGSSPDIDPASQVRQALDRLAGANLRPEDVDLVTVGMGGNDAKFGDVVKACVAPSLIAELLRRYPNTPGEAQSFFDYLTCSFIDSVGIKSDDAIKQLAAKEAHAQQLLLGAFPNARVLQVDYPNIVPLKDSPSWCGGLRAGDIDFARKKVKKINSAVRTATLGVARTNPRLDLVEQEKTFGSNALCPGQDGRLLANGLNKANVDREVARLLNLDGKGDAKARAKMDALVTAYRAWKNCIGNQLNPLDRQSCDVSQKTEALKAKGMDLVNYLLDNQKVILGNVVSPPGSSDDTTATAFDRTSGLFHPNANGFAVQACNVLDAVKSMSSNCSGAVAPPVGEINGQPITNKPFVTSPQQVVRLLVNGFRGLTKVRLKLFSEPIDLGEAQADQDGSVQTSFTLPNLNAGVHTLEVEGVGAGGVKVTQQVLLDIPGRPTGEYSAYLCCFEPEPEVISPDAPQEDVEVTIAGISLGTYQPDEDGGVLVHVPTIDRLRDSSALVVEATSKVTGKVVRQLLNPIPSAPSLWATGTGTDAVTISGNSFTATGRVHSEGGIQLTGSGATLRGGVEYDKDIKISGRTPIVDPVPVKTTAGQGTPPAQAIQDYRPQGRIAASGQPYRAVPQSACQNGVWTPKPKDVAGVVYVPCAVVLTGGGTFDATIAAEGPITIAGNGTVVGPTTAGAPSLITGSSADIAIAVSGSRVTIRGTAYAINGTARGAGVGFTVQCGIVASRIAISGSGGSAPMGSRCLSNR